ncbi:hypothetical protein SBRCBS47491_005108 [Sporothrix bragantina]|uniref:Aminotransferase class I/classII large domain-containing protein n=1 Tax=Sporothrix bragantina TaxID=671064 RepID=A0ABP0BU06_9PEZI
MGSHGDNFADSPLTAVAQQLHLSPTLQINEASRLRAEKGLPVVRLGFGEATFPIQKDVLAAHRDASESTSYLPVAGLLELRQSIAAFQSRRLGCPVSASQVVVAPGSKPLLFALFDILQGDVLLPRPSWVSYEPQVAHAGKKLFWVETDAVDRHTITAESLEASYTKALAEGARPRMLLINSPSNPTGRVFSEATLQTITAFCDAHEIVLLSDEIYSDIVFDETFTSAPSPCGNGAFNTGLKIMTGGLSKTYSAGGWRVGYAIVQDTAFGTTVQKALLAYASECWSAASSPAQAAAAVAFSTTPAMDNYRSQVARLHRQCARGLYCGLKECGLDVAKPQGSFYVYPSFSPYAAQLRALGIHTSLELSHWLLQECGVAALPGSAFGEVDDDSVPGGQYRLRMATSYLYFKDEAERYGTGYDLLAKATSKADADISLPLLREAIQAVHTAVEKLKAVEV